MLGQLRRTRHEVPAGAQHRGPGESVCCINKPPFFGVALATDRTHVGAQATQSDMIAFSVNRDGSSEQRDI